MVLNFYLLLRNGFFCGGHVIIHIFNFAQTGKERTVFGPVGSYVVSITILYIVYINQNWFDIAKFIMCN